MLAAIREPIPGCDVDVPHVGVIFVHGIGSQHAGETLREWSAPIVEALADYLIAFVAKLPRDDPRRTTIRTNPVIRSQLDPDPAAVRFIELELPAQDAPPEPRHTEWTKAAYDYIDEVFVDFPPGVASESDDERLHQPHRRRPVRHWILTEAAWSSRSAPPSFGTMAEWLGPSGALSDILATLIPGGERVLFRGPRYQPYYKSSERGSALPSRPPIASGGTRLGLGLYLQAVSSVVLVTYGAFRAVERVLPIGPLRDRVLSRRIDEFLLDWFGDVYVLLSDRAQAASIRSKLDEVIASLTPSCSRLVVVAHSGGAIVTYAALAESAFARRAVDRVVTFGQGLNLARRLANVGRTHDQARTRFPSLYRDIGNPELVWNDFWASDDPAPVGRLECPIGTTCPTTTSKEVVNRLSVREDHGAYWENDEEFVLPLIKLIDTQNHDIHGWESPLFNEDWEAFERAAKRRIRVAQLAYWRQLVALTPFAGLLGAYALNTSFVDRLYGAATDVWERVPGHKVIDEPLGLARAVALATDELGGPVLDVLGRAVLLVLFLGTTLSPLVWSYHKTRAWGDHQGLCLFLELAGRGAVVGLIALAALRLFLGVTASSLGLWAWGVLLVAFVGTVVGLFLFAMVLPPPGSVATESDRRPPAGRLRGRSSGYLTIASSFMIVASVPIAVSPVLLALVHEDVGQLLVATALIYASAWLIGKIGTWRWETYDRQTRRHLREGTMRSATFVRAEAVLLLVGLGTATLLVATDAVFLAPVAIAAAALAVIVGIASDVAGARAHGEIAGVG